MQFPEHIQAAIDGFRKIPGVGEKTAIRQVLTMAMWPKKDLLDFSESVGSLRNLRNCQKCGAFSSEEICLICSDKKRLDTGSLCVVENYSDFLAIEKSAQFKGSYHILGGVLNPLLGIGPNELNMKSLFQRVLEDGVAEMILALNPSVEGDATCAYINQKLPEGVDTNRIGFGIPIGGSLEYLDPMTISRALENRTKF